MTKAISIIAAITCGAIACPAVADNGLNEKINIAIAKILPIGADKITRDTHLVDDLGADSIDIVEVLMESEEQTSINFPDKLCHRDLQAGELYNWAELNRP